MTAVAGAVAGVLGLKGVWGFLFYAVTWAVVSAGLLVRTGWPATRHFRSTSAVVTDGFWGGLQVRHGAHVPVRAFSTDTRARVPPAPYSRTFFFGRTSGWTTARSCRSLTCGEGVRGGVRGWAQALPGHRVHLLRRANRRRKYMCTCTHGPVRKGATRTMCRHQPRPSTGCVCPRP
jgi:hypothetical protein